MLREPWPHPLTPPPPGWLYGDPTSLVGYVSPNHVSDEPEGVSHSVVESLSPSDQASVPNDSFGDCDPATPATSQTILLSAHFVAHSTEPSNTSRFRGRKRKTADEVCLVTGLRSLLTASRYRPSSGLMSVKFARRSSHVVRGLLIGCDGSLTGLAGHDLARE